MIKIRAILIVMLVGLGLSSVPAQADDATIDAFFGRYAGTAISTSDEGLSKRDLSVHIVDAGAGAFTLDWMTFTRKADGRRKRKSYSITFKPTKRESIYASAMRRDKFGNVVPLDPLKGEPYVWARIQGKTLSVHALHIIEDGGYELQVYERTLKENGLELRFSRIRNGKQLKLITGSLERFDN
ncbi:MAG: hypothetical protein ISR44_09165 [Rhodospirillales bacterium]|nr:hypothetical protein [Rhodospirillales bacterium]